MIKFVQVPCPSSCPSSGSSNSRTLIFSSSGCLVIEKSGISLRAGAPRFQAGPDSRQAPIPTLWPRAETRTWTRTWTRNLDKFYHVFSSCRATCPSSPGELGQGTWTTAGCRVTSSLSITPRFQAGNSVCLAPAETRTWTRTWTRNLDKFYHVFFSYRATCPSSPGELGQGTWTTAGCRVTSSLSITPRFQAGPDSVCLASLFRGRFPNGFYST